MQDKYMWSSYVLTFARVHAGDQTCGPEVERLLKEQPARGQHQVFTDVF